MFSLKPQLISTQLHKCTSTSSSRHATIPWHWLGSWKDPRRPRTCPVYWCFCISALLSKPCTTSVLSPTKSRICKPGVFWWSAAGCRVAATREHISARLQLCSSCWTSTRQEGRGRDYSIMAFLRVEGGGGGYCCKGVLLNCEALVAIYHLSRMMR